MWMSVLVVFGEWFCGLPNRLRTTYDDGNDQRKDTRTAHSRWIIERIEAIFIPSKKQITHLFWIAIAWPTGASNYLFTVELELIDFLPSSKIDKQ